MHLAMGDLGIYRHVSTGGRVKYLYSSLDKISVGCISGSGKIRAGVFRFYGFWVDPTDLGCIFFELFLFCQKQKFYKLITQNCQYLMKKYSNCNFITEC